MKSASVVSSLGYSFSSLSTTHSMLTSGSYRSSTEWISGFTSFVKVKDELDTYLSEKLVPFIIDELFDVLT